MPDGVSPEGDGLQKELNIERRAAEIKASWENPVYSFEEQFTHREPSAIIDAVDVRPPEQEQKAEPPIVFLPGWSETLEDFREGIEELYNAHRRVIATSHTPPKLATKGSAIHTEYAQELNTLLEEKGLTKINILARSGSTITAIEFAKMHPDKVANIVFFNPAGLIGKRTHRDLGARFVRQAVESASNKSGALMKIDLSQNSRPLTNVQPTRFITTPREAYAISQKDIREDLTALREDHGIGTAVIATEKDALFPTSDIQVTTPDLEPILHDRDRGYAMVDRFLSMPGTHSEPKKQQKIFMDVADQAFTDLHSLQKERLHSDSSVLP